MERLQQRAKTAKEKLPASITRHEKLVLQVFSYGVVAAVGLVVDFCTLIFVKEVLNLHYLIGVCAGFLAGLACTYILSNRFVFGTPKMSTHQAFVLFGIIGLVGLAILNALVWLLTDKIKLNYLISKSLATIVVFAWNFAARRSLFKEDQL